MAVTGLFGRGNLSKLQASIELPEEIFAERPTLGRIQLQNRRRWLPGFLLEIESGGRQVLIPLVPAGATKQVFIELLFPRRGEQPLPEITLRSCFPVNFFSRQFRFRPDGSALVFPTPRPCVQPADERDLQSLGTAHSRQAGHEGELRAITDYRGEPLKAIHWKLSARQDDLMVKQHSGLSQPPVLIELAALPGNLEQKLSHASHLIMTLSRGNRPVGLRLADTTITAASGQRQRQMLLQELALYAQS